MGAPWGLLVANAGPLMAGLAVLTLAALGACIWLAVRLRRLERHYNSLLAGTSGGNLPQILETHVNAVREALRQVRAVDALAHHLEDDARSHVQHVALVRYNPFRDTGGDQSFVLALTDAKGNGAVLTSLHMRDVTRIYAKPLNAWSSSHPLGDEEQQAIHLAQNQ